MPEFLAVISEDELASKIRGGRPKVDLGPYVAYLGSVPPKAAGHIAISEGEKRQTVKRHITLAGQEIGRSVLFHRSGQNELIFEVLPPDAPKPARRGGRPKKNSE